MAAADSPALPQRRRQRRRRRPGGAHLLRPWATTAALFAYCLLVCAAAGPPSPHMSPAKYTPSPTGAGLTPAPHALAAAVVRIHVARPSGFDRRLQAAFATGLTSQLARGGRGAWVAAAAHETVAAAPSAAAARHLLQPRTGGTRYLLTIVVKAAESVDAEEARDKLVDAINRLGTLCKLQMNAGMTGLCEYAAEYAEIDKFNAAKSVVVVSSRASATAVPAAAAAAGTPPPCRSEGEGCDGAAVVCCGWGMSECDLRPGAPTEGTCRSLTGAAGPSCAKQGKPCRGGFDCCPYLKCAASGAAAGGKRCTWTPEHAALALNVTVRGAFSAEAQAGLLAAARHWLLHEGSGAVAARVVSYEPLAPPAAAAWAADPTYRYELLVGAPTRAALDAALRTALRELGGGGGSKGAGGVGSTGGGGGGGTISAAGGGREEEEEVEDEHVRELCRLPVSSAGKGVTVCSLAKARCGEKKPGGKPCEIDVVGSSAAAVARVDASYKEAPCRAAGEACGGPFNVTGACCSGQMCTMGVPGDGAGRQTGVCRPKCKERLKVCSKDAQCCSYWGPMACNKQLGICLPAAVSNMTRFAYTR